jgi:WhiB family redox-sensing transcriptional regulator
VVSKKSHWEQKAICAGSDIDFFAEADLSDTATDADIEIAQLETKQARSVCVHCPVRRDCIEQALETKTLWGTWGGADQETIRKALSLNENKEPVTRAKDMVCPYCYSDNLLTTIRRKTQTRIECKECNLFWWSAKSDRPIPIKVKDYSEGLE